MTQHGDNSTSSDCSDGSEKLIQDISGSPSTTVISEPQPETTTSPPPEIKEENPDHLIKLESPETETCAVPKPADMTQSSSRGATSSSDTSDSDSESDRATVKEFDGSQNHSQASLSYYTSFLSQAKTSQAERASSEMSAEVSTDSHSRSIEGDENESNRSRLIAASRVQSLTSSPETALPPASELLPAMSVTSSPLSWTPLSGARRESTMVEERSRLHSGDHPQRPPLLRRPPFEPVETPSYTHESTGPVRSPRRMQERRLHAMPYGNHYYSFYESRYHERTGPGHPVQIPERRIREELLGPLNNRFSPSTFESHSWNGSDSLPWVEALPRINTMVPLSRHRSFTTRQTRHFDTSYSNYSYDSYDGSSLDYDYQPRSNSELRPLESLLYPERHPQTSPNWIYNLGASTAVTRADIYSSSRSDRLVPVLMDAVTGEIFPCE